MKKFEDDLGFVNRLFEIWFIKAMYNFYNVITFDSKHFSFHAELTGRYDQISVIGFRINLLKIDWRGIEVLFYFLGLEIRFAIIDNNIFYPTYRAMRG